MVWAGKEKEASADSRSWREDRPNGLLQATWWWQRHNVNDGSDPSKRSKLLRRERLLILDLNFFCLLFRSGMKFSARIRFVFRYGRNDSVFKSVRNKHIFYRLRCRCEIFWSYQLGRDWVPWFKTHYITYNVDGMHTLTKVDKIRK